MNFLYGAAGGLIGVLVLVTIVAAIVLYFTKAATPYEPPHP